MQKQSLDTEVTFKYQTQITVPPNKVDGVSALSQMQSWATQLSSGLSGYFAQYNIHTFRDLLTELLRNEELGGQCWPPQIIGIPTPQQCVIDAHNTLYAFLGICVVEIYEDFKRADVAVLEAFLDNPTQLSIFNFTAIPAVNSPWKAPKDQSVTYTLTLNVNYKRNITALLNRLQEITAHSSFSVEV